MIRIPFMLEMPLLSVVVNCEVMPFNDKRDLMKADGLASGADGPSISMPWGTPR
jgi:hypothetical protein